MSILILNRIGLRALPYHLYLEDVAQKEAVLLTDVGKVPTGELEAYRKLYREVVELEGYESAGLMELTAEALHRRHSFTKIVAISEFDLIRAGRLRDRWKIQGQGYDSAIAFRDKLVMKQFAERGDIKVPASRRVDTAVDILEFVEQHGYPAVVKPILGSGAVTTHIVRDDTDLRRVLATDVVRAELPASFEIEQFVSGRMYHVDGILSDGRPVVCWPSTYVNECHNFASGKALGSYQLEAANPLSGRLNAFAHKLLRALPTPRDGAFHIEAFHTPGDELVLCEVTSRVGGPRIPDAHEVGFGLHLVRALVRALAGVPLDLPPSKRLEAPHRLGGFLLIPARSGTLIKAPTCCSLPGVLDFQMLQEPGSQGTDAVEPTDFVATFVFEAACESDMRARIDAATTWFEQNASWERNA